MTKSKDQFTKVAISRNKKGENVFKKSEKLKKEILENLRKVRL